MRWSWLIFMEFIIAFGNRSLCISMRGDLDYIIVVRRITLDTRGTIPWAGSCTTETGGKKLNPSIFSTHLLTRSGPSSFHQQDFTMVDCILNYEQHSLFLHVAATRQGTESKLSPSKKKGKGHDIALLGIPY